MTELDDILVPEAFNLVEELGKELAFTPPTGTYTPGAGSVVPGTPAPFNAKATPPFPTVTSWATGSLVQEGRTICLLPAQGLAQAPKPGWTVTIDGAVWTATRVTPIYSGELVAIHELELER